jgi:enoyl-CoA hydratase/carnithine racemase
VVPAGTQIDRALEIAAKIAENAPLALIETKRHARLALDETHEVAAQALPKVRNELMATNDFREGIASFMERREAKFEGS